MKQLDFDALIVGAGFGGIYQLHSLLGLGLSVKVIDQAGDVGGTWYWNRYPGAMSDTESYIYRFSWDKEDLLSYPWKEHYVKQPEVLAYLNHVVEKYDLRKHMQFNTQLLSADWDDEKVVWRVEVSTGEKFTARYLITALGLLSKQNYPDIRGIDTYQGEMHHTGKWPQGFDFTGKRAGVIGCGSTGVQLIIHTAKRGKSLTCFQRHPQYSVPSGDGPVSEEYRKYVNEHYDEIFDQVRNSITAFGFKESTIPAMSVSPEERERIFQENWDKGNGFRFMFGTFCDITYDKEANEAACDFIRRKIAQIVKDPEKARKLTPRDYNARRPLCDGGYFEQFNRENVDVVGLKETPITEMTEKGIRTSDGKEHELDVIIFATGFDAVDGNHTRVRIHGRNGETLKDHWKEGPTSYLGMCVPNFPNLFMITGPNGPFTNIPPTIETHVVFVTDAIKQAERNKRVVEATLEAEKGSSETCEQLAANSLFKVTDSWVFGANIPGKKHALMFFFGGLQNYRERLKEVVDDNWRGFKPFATTGSSDNLKPPSTVVAEAQSPLTLPVALKLGSAAFAFFVAGVNDGSLGALLPYVLRGYHISTGSVAILYGTAFAGWVVAALVGGYVRAHMGSGGALVLGAGSQLVAFALRVWEPPFGVFCATFLLAALGQAFQDSQANTFVSTVKAAHRWLGVVHASYGFGCLVGPLIATAIASARPERWTWFYWLLLGLGVTNLVFVTWAFRGDMAFVTMLDGEAENLRQKGKAQKAWKETKATLKEKVVWLLSLFFFFHLGVGITAGGWIVEYLVTVRKSQLSKVGYVTTGFYGGLALGRLVLAEPTYRLGERRMLLLYSVLCLALQLVFWRVKNAIADAVAVSCMGFLLGPYFATGINVGTKLIPQEIHASALGLVFVIAQAGGAIFPALTGVIATKAGVGVLQPILIGLIVAMGVSWALIPKVIIKQS